MNVLCKRVHLLDLDPDRNLDCYPDRDLDNFCSVYWNLGTESNLSLSKSKNLQTENKQYQNITLVLSQHVLTTGIY